jgi:hypothetical protein
MSRVEAVSVFLRDRFPKGIQMFNCRGIDPVEMIYSENDVKIYWSWYYEYIEVFGLSNEEYAELENILLKNGWEAWQA